jgi:putative hydrolase of the HAD superfamily
MPRITAIGFDADDTLWHNESIFEKDASVYRRLLDRHGIAPEEFVMVGNSLKSDILPVLELGGRGVQVPYRITWAAEQAGSLESSS